MACLGLGEGQQGIQHAQLMRAIKANAHITGDGAQTSSWSFFTLVRALFYLK